LAPRLALLVQDHPDLLALLDTWPELPEAIRAGIVATVQAVTRASQEESSHA